MSSGVDLTDAVGGQIRFWGKWDIQTLWDACFFEASINGGTSWTPVATERTGLTSGQGAQIPGGVPAFDGVQSAWVLNTADLSPVLGVADLRLRFRMASDSSTTGAGFYLDDFTVEIQRLVVSDTVPGVRTPVAAVRAWPNPFNPATTTFRHPAGPVTPASRSSAARLRRICATEKSSGMTDCPFTVSGSSTQAPVRTMSCVSLKYDKGKMTPRLVARRKPGM